jgi:hypothetical protein
LVLTSIAQLTTRARLIYFSLYAVSDPGKLKL